MRRENFLLWLWGIFGIIAIFAIINDVETALAVFVFPLIVTFLDFIKNL